MGRILAIDYGTKRTGIAVTDPLKIIANSLTTVRSCDLIQFLKDYFSKETVEQVVIGMPTTLRNEPAENAQYVKIFEKQFKKEFPNMPLSEIDERFTSTIAHQTMIAGGMKKKDRQNKAVVDSISATIILQSFMEGPPPESNTMLSYYVQ